MSYTTPTLTSAKPVTLVVIGYTHPICQYSWKCLERPGIKYPNTSVLFVNSPGLYTCSVISKEEEVFSVLFLM